MRLIDADALTQDLAKDFAGGCGGEATLEQIVSDDTLADAIKTVEEQPTVDAMPVIRCKDCKRFDGYTTAPEKYWHDGYCQWWARNTYLDYWCCGAERRDDA